MQTHIHSILQRPNLGLLMANLILSRPQYNGATILSLLVLFLLVLVPGHLHVVPGGTPFAQHPKIVVATAPQPDNCTAQLACSFTGKPAPNPAGLVTKRGGGGGARGGSARGRTITPSP